MPQIKCSRCKKTKLVSEDYQFKICPQCREYNYKERHKLTDEDLEKIVIRELISVEEKFREHKRLCKRMKMPHQTKDAFIKQFLEGQKIQIASYKRFLAKYKTESLQLHSVDCLKFRGMLADRALNQDWQPKTDYLMNLWLNHSIKCSDCASWYKLNSNQDLMQIPYNENGCSQKEFDSALDDFYGIFQKPTDPIDAYLDRMTDVCMSCGRNKITIPENGRVVCPYCEPRM